MIENNIVSNSFKHNSIQKSIKKNVFKFSIGLIICLVLLPSCNKTESSDNSPNTENNNTQKSEINSSSKDGKISALLDISQKPIKKLVPVDLKLTLKKGNNGVRNADITLDLTMPGMEMPKNIINLKESLAGIYSGQAMFTMSGDWRIYAKAKFDGQSQDMYFDIKVQ